MSSLRPVTLRMRACVRPQTQGSSVRRVMSRSGNGSSAAPFGDVVMTSSPCSPWEHRITGLGIDHSNQEAVLPPVQTGPGLDAFGGDPGPMISDSP